MDCWKKYGSPKIDNDKVRAAQPLIGAVYDLASAGGSLHIVLDDWNLGDAMVSYCRSLIENPPPDYPAEDMTPERKAAELACCAAFEAMTVEERASALLLFDYAEEFEKA